MSEPPVERRFQRVPFGGDVRVYTGSAMAGTRLIDISLKGALVDRPAGWEALIPDHPTLGDVDSPEALAEYQAGKRARKAELKAQGQG